MKRIWGRILKVLALGIATTITVPAKALDCDLTGTVRYLAIQESALGSNYFSIKPTTGASTCGNCIDTTKDALLLLPEGDRGKGMLAVVLSAWLAGKVVYVYVSDNNSPGPVYCQVKKLHVED